VAPNGTPESVLPRIAQISDLKMLKDDDAQEDVSNGSMTISGQTTFQFNYEERVINAYLLQPLRKRFKTGIAQ
jgi:hypothetical protein